MKLDLVYSLTGEFWFGLTPLHCLTNQGQWEMSINFTLTDKTKIYLTCSSFKVGPASSNYQVSISAYNGIAPTDPIAGPHSLNGMPFATKDKDNDKWSSKNCTKDKCWWMVVQLMLSQTY